MDTLNDWVDKLPELFCLVLVGNRAFWKASQNNKVEVISRESGKNELLFLASKVHDWFNAYTNLIEQHKQNAISRLLGEDDSAEQERSSNRSQGGFQMQAYMEPNNLKNRA